MRLTEQCGGIEKKEVFQAAKPQSHQLRLSSARGYCGLDAIVKKKS